MAKVSFDSIPESSSNNGSGNNSRVTFFSLKNGESAIVRIMIDSVDDLDIRTVHNVEMPGYQYGRRMNCLRNPNEPMDLCPLCAAGKSIEQKLYIKMIQYNVDSNGTVTKEAKVWERGVFDRNFGARAIKSNIEAYGPLSQMICKIERRGEKLNTEYQFMPNLNPEVYRPDIFVKDASMFDGWDPLGVAILDKTAAEYQVFLATGQFPQTSQTPNNIPTTTPSVNTEVSSPAAPKFDPAAITPRGEAPVTSNDGLTSNSSSRFTSLFNPQPAVSTPPNAGTNTGAMPWETKSMGWEGGAQPSMERPRRY